MADTYLDANNHRSNLRPADQQANNQNEILALCSIVLETKMRGNKDRANCMLHKVLVGICRGRRFICILGRLSLPLFRS